MMDRWYGPVSQAVRSGGQIIVNPPVVQSGPKLLDGTVFFQSLEVLGRVKNLLLKDEVLGRLVG